MLCDIRGGGSASSGAAAAPLPGPALALQRQDHLSSSVQRASRAKGTWSPVRKQPAARGRSPVHCQAGQRVARPGPAQSHASSPHLRRRPPAAPSAPSAWPAEWPPAPGGPRLGRPPCMTQGTVSGANGRSPAVRGAGGCGSMAVWGAGGSATSPCTAVETVSGAKRQISGSVGAGGGGLSRAGLPAQPSARGQQL